MLFEIDEVFSEFYGKNVFIARYNTTGCRGYSSGETRREAVINAASSFLDEDEEIVELLEAVYDAGKQELDVKRT